MSNCAFITGYERDGETGLDYAQARYFGSSLGRFTSVDAFGPWAMTEEEKIEFLSLPQRWNRYAYVSGNPLKYSDPTGLYVCDNTVSGECTKIQKVWKLFEIRALKNSRNSRIGSCTKTTRRSLQLEIKLLSSSTT
ncbi:MAG: RHS repeat-associated core domain-containing protein [Chloracidobacterium sp.]|nr:RHS repeat-associated core domain-containing protein [Chloracidobacterium sp.]